MAFLDEVEGGVMDEEVLAAIAGELRRQQSQVELIASENFVSQNVLAVLGGVLTNKYAEGYPSRRYYGGCEFVDVVENIAIDRLRRLFHCRFANVQPHSGAQANLAVLFALAKPGDTILGMSLAMGGHLTHGAAPTVSGRWFRAVGYGVTVDGIIDYDNVQRLAEEHKPKIIIAGASSYCRRIDFERFREIADSVGAYLFADVAHYAGLIVADLYPSPMDHAHVVTSTTHKTLRGPRGGVIMTNHEDIAKKIDSAVFPGTQGGPHMHIIAAKAVAFGEALRPEFRAYAKNVLENSRALANQLRKCGLEVISGGTDCHMSVINLGKLSISGKIAETELERAGVTCNKNAIPYDPLPVSQTSGIRVGTAAMTTRGFGIREFELVGRMIHLVLSNYGKADYDAIRDGVRAETLRVCREFPIYD
ncbi:MAG: serine hydroxymethyltransferase [Holosporaceae bacterium]|jgi:glycine hydroxymethyltransferase|nr:serine hydroxymethyltransferase [Holosporaceae bacterium]